MTMWSCPAAEVAEQAELDAEELGEEVGDLIVGRDSPASVRPSAFALIVAFVQCWIRRRCPATGSWKLARSPTAKTSGSPLRKCSSTTTAPSVERDPESGEVRRRRARRRRRRSRARASMRRPSRVVAWLRLPSPWSSVTTSPRMTLDARGRGRAARASVDSSGCPSAAKRRLGRARSPSPRGRGSGARRRSPSR